MWSVCSRSVQPGLYNHRAVERNGSDLRHLIPPSMRSGRRPSGPCQCLVPINVNDGWDNFNLLGSECFTTYRPMSSMQKGPSPRRGSLPGSRGLPTGTRSPSRRKPTVPWPPCSDISAGHRGLVFLLLGDQRLGGQQSEPCDGRNVLAFCRVERVTLAGSMIPDAIRSS